MNESIKLKNNRQGNILSIAGAGPVPHLHAAIEEVFYILEGELYFRPETSAFMAKKDDTITIPKGGIIHNFKNNSANPAKLLFIVYPAGLDDFFIESAALINSSSNELYLKEQLASLSEKHGQQLYSPN